MLAQTGLTMELGDVFLLCLFFDVDFEARESLYRILPQRRKGAKKKYQNPTLGFSLRLCAFAG